MPKNKKSEMLAMIAYTILLACATVHFHLNYLTSTVLFFIPLSLYVTVKRPQSFKSLGIFSVLIGLPFVLIIDSIGLLNHAWWETSVFSHRIFGLVPYETALWAILYTYFIISVYEYFFGKSESVHFSRRFRNFFGALIVGFCLFLFVLFTHPSLLAIPYFYGIFVALFYVMPTVVGLVGHPKEFSRLWKQCLFFSILLFVGELAALGANQWGFAGSQYLGMIHITGVHFPFEEFTWILIGVPAYLWVYRYLTSGNSERGNVPVS